MHYKGRDIISSNSPPGRPGYVQGYEQAAHISTQRYKLVADAPGEPIAADGHAEGPALRLLEAARRVIVGCVDVHLGYRRLQVLSNVTEL